MIALCSKCYFIDDRGEKKEVQHKGNVEEAKRYNLAAFQGSVRRKQGYGNKQRVSDAGWKNSNLRAGEAGVECLL